MAKTIAQVLDYEQLTGRIQAVVGGVPTDILPAGFATPNRSIAGNQCTYTKVEGTRQTARLVHYGSPSVRRSLTGISEVPVTLIHTFEHESHKPSTLMMLREETSPARQALGAQEVGRQVASFGQLFRNLRTSSVYSIFAKGAIHFDGDGNLLPSSTGAKVTVDMKIPAGNKAQLDVFGGGDILDADWNTAGTDIAKQIKALKTAARKLTGYPLRYAFYGANIPGYLLGNTQIKALIAGSATLSEQMARADIPDGLLGLTWRPVDEAFFVDKDSSYQDWFDGDQITFSPEPSPEWWEFIEGSYPVPTSIDLSSDALAALGNVTEATGSFSYAQLTTDPVTIKHLAGDTFLPVAKVPKAMFLATVPTS